MGSEWLMRYREAGGKKMGLKIPKHFLEAHRLISRRAKPKREAHGRAEYNHLAELRSIFQDRNVVGLGVAEKVTSGRSTGELSLCFYVRKKKARKGLRSHKMIPPVVSVGGRKPIFTDVYELGGAFKALVNKQESPLQSGFSVGTVTNTNAGTAGAIVSFGSTQYILSNAHVFFGKPGKTGISYPAIRDNNNTTNRVGVLRHIVSLSADGNRADAALAEIDSGLSIDPFVSDANTPYKIGVPELRMKVVGRGRSTTSIRGVVNTLPFSGPVEDVPGVGTIRFVDQVACEGNAEEGDSGALIVAEETGEIVGLLFAGVAGGFLFTPIKSVREELGVNFSFVNPGE